MTLIMNHHRYKILRFLVAMVAILGVLCCFLVLSVQNYVNLLADGHFLPKEIVERVAAGMDFGYHLVEVSAELVYADLFSG